MRNLILIESRQYKSSFCGLVHKMTRLKLKKKLKNSKIFNNESEEWAMLVHVNMLFLIYIMSA